MQTGCPIIGGSYERIYERHAISFQTGPGTRSCMSQSCTYVVCFSVQFRTSAEKLAPSKIPATLLSTVRHNSVNGVSRLDPFFFCGEPSTLGIRRDPARSGAFPRTGAPAVAYQTGR